MRLLATLSVLLLVCCLVAIAQTQNTVPKYGSGGNLVDSVITESSGAVGLGTASPGAPLEIKSSLDAKLRLRKNGGGWNYIEFYNDSSRTAWLGMISDSLLGINGQFALNTSTGNITTGEWSVSTPARLQVITANENGSGVNAWDSRHVVIGQSGSQGSGVSIAYSSVNGYGVINALSPGVAWRNLVLQDGGGNVGIGTRTPASKLHVYRRTRIGQRVDSNHAAVVTANA